MTARAINPLPDHQIKSKARLLTLDELQARGLTRSDYVYTEIENTLYDAKQKNQHIITVGWPDGIYCFFSSSTELRLEHLFPVQLQEAYRKGFYDHHRDNWLG